MALNKMSELFCPVSTHTQTSYCRGAQAPIVCTLVIPVSTRSVVVTRQLRFGLATRHIYKS